MIKQTIIDPQHQTSSQELLYRQKCFLYHVVLAWIADPVEEISSRELHAHVSKNVDNLCPLVQLTCQKRHQSTAWHLKLNFYPPFLKVMACEAPGDNKNVNNRCHCGNLWQDVGCSAVCCGLQFSHIPVKMVVVD